MAYATSIMPGKAMIDAAGACTTFKGIIMIKDRMIAFIVTLFLMLPIVFLGCLGDRAIRQFQAYRQSHPSRMRHSVFR